MRLGSQIAISTLGQNTGDIVDRMIYADGDRLRLAFMEVGMRMMRLEKLPQSHRVRSSLRWLRRWHVRICEEMRRRAEMWARIT